MCFLVSTDHYIIRVVKPRTEYALELGYEISSKVAKAYADALQESDLDLSTYQFGTYEEIQENLKKKSSVKEPKKVYVKRTPTPRKKKTVAKEPKVQRKRTQQASSTQAEDPEETKLKRLLLFTERERQGNR